MPKRKHDPRKFRKDGRPLAASTRKKIKEQEALEKKFARERGRPGFKYTTAIGEAICRRLAMGESLIRICETEGFPDRHTVMHWLFNSDLPHHEVFSAMYARAREDQAEYFAEKMRETAADADEESKNGVNKARLIIDTDKWIASKLKPKKFGDKVDVSSSEPLKVIISPTDAKL